MPERRGLMAFLRAYPETGGVLALGAVTMLAAWIAVDAKDTQGLGSANFVFGALATIVCVGAVVRLAIRRSLGDASPRHLIVTIFTSYGVLILSFASMYYVQSGAGDYRDACAEVSFYGEIARRIDAGELDPGELPDFESRRAFNGIRDRLWTGLDGFGSSETDGVPLPLTASEKVDVARGRPVEEVVAFRSDGRLGVAIDCLHLSVATMTTLGYGDVSPRDSFARLSTDAQVLASGILVLVALARAFALASSVEARGRD